MNLDPTYEREKKLGRYIGEVVTGIMYKLDWRSRDLARLVCGPNGHTGTLSSCLRN